jgi:hypothetical protein
MQTTVNDIASLFMGNPGALQNRIQKEQQAKPGIPPDLKELLALQQIQEQLQAAQQQQALQNPQNQPTVAQSLQQAAKQALMARQVQAQQQQMAQAGQMGLPQGLPQPQHQPQMGLDQIPTNLGEYYGGGIVAFKEGDLVEKIPGQSDYVAPEGEKIDSSELERNIRNTILASGASISRLATAPRQALALLSEAFQRRGPKSESIPNNQKDDGNAPTAEEIEAASKPYIGYRSPPKLAGQEPKKYQELEKIMQQSETPYDASTATRRESYKEAPLKPPAPRPTGIAALPAAKPTASPEAEKPAAGEINKPTAAQKIFAARMAEDPEQVAKAMATKFTADVGPQGFNEERELIKELQARRANIGKGTNPLMDLLEGIATSAPGRGGILSQGAEGVRNARAMQMQREQQNMDMLKEILGQQKVISTGERAYKKDLFDLYQTTYKDVYKNTFEAAKAQDKSDSDAAKLAQDAAEYAANRKSQEQIAKDRNENALRVANIGAASRKSDDAILNISKADAAVANRVRSDEVINTLQKRLEQLGNMPTEKNAIEAKKIIQDISDRQSQIMKEVYSRYGIKDLDGAKMPEAPGTTSSGNRAPLSSFQR